jgi:hypothetical protein
MSRRLGERAPARGATLGAAIRSARALVLAGGLALLGVAGAAAQATPEGGVMASPAAGPCEAPEGMAGMEATPAASPMATPEGGDEGALPVGTPADDQALIDEAVAAAENLANCWNAGDLEAVVGLVTPNLLQTKFGVADAEEAAAALGGMDLPAYSILSVGDAQTYDDGRASLDLDYLLGDHQYTAARWYMVEADGQLLIDAEELRFPQPDVEASSVIGVAFADDESPAAFVQEADEAGARSVPFLPAIILNVDNSAGTEQRILSVVRLAEGTEGTPAAGAFPEDAEEFVAQVSVPAGDQVDVALVDLEVGSFAIGEVGGESVPLTITEPEPEA